MPTSLLFECIDEVVPAITHVVNESFLSGTFPSMFKPAIVKPLLKKPSLDRDDLKNYRPVSNLSFLPKVAEKLVLPQLSEYLNANQLFSPVQSAYRPNYSTETALVKIVNDLLLALDDGKVSDLTLLDLSAAFDTIYHNILLYRQEHAFGITGTALSWIRLYLSDRDHQTVVVNGLKSEPLRLLYGVPQGSVLGPILFVLPLDDIFDRHSVCHHSFADDTQMRTLALLTNLINHFSYARMCF